MGLSRMALLLFALPAAAPAQLSAQPAGSFQQRVLDIHNRERAAIGSAPLRWNPQLEQDAANHARQLARTGQLTHAPREGRGIVRENLSRGPLGWGPDQLMRNWINEKRHFHGGIYPNVCTGGWSSCAHYTQVIWPGTTDVGCGAANGAGFSWFVCRYSPGGNKDGRRLGAAVDPLYSGTPGPIDSSKSRQRLGTPGQASRRSNLEVLCREPEPMAQGGSDASARMQEAVAKRKALEAEMKELQHAIALLQEGLSDQIKPDLFERVTGISLGGVPSDEQLRLLADRLKQLMEKARADQERVEEMLQELSRQHEKRMAREELCGRRSRQPGEVE